MSLWPTRIGWALLGAGVAVVAMSWAGREQSSTQDERAPAQIARSEGRTGSGESASPMKVAVTAAAATPGDSNASRSSTAPGASGSVGSSPTSGASGTSGPSPTSGVSGTSGPSPTSGDFESPDEPVEPTAAGTSAVVDATATEPDALPEVPLPKMPGTRFMRRFRLPREDGPGWEIQLGLSVPAPGSQVAAFYRAALKDAGIKLKVRRASDTGAIKDGYSGTLRGEGGGAWAQVNIHQRPNRVRTVVRIVWRTG